MGVIIVRDVYTNLIVGSR